MKRDGQNLQDSVLTNEEEIKLGKLGTRDNAYQQI